MKNIIALGLMCSVLSACSGIGIVQALGGVVVSIAGDTNTPQQPTTYHLVCDNETPSHCWNE